jgi:hypothetical protein
MRSRDEEHTYNALARRGAYDPYDATHLERVNRRAALVDSLRLRSSRTLRPLQYRRRRHVSQRAEQRVLLTLGANEVLQVRHSVPDTIGSPVRPLCFLHRFAVQP